MATTLPKPGGVRYAPIAAEPEEPADATAQVTARTWALSPMLWVGLATVGLVGWSVAETGGGQPLALIGLTLVAAIGFALGSSRQVARLLADRLNTDVFNVIAVGAISAAAFVSATSVSPFVLLVPAAVGLAVLTNRTEIFSDLAVILGLAGLLATGLRMTLGLDQPYVATGVYLGSLAFLTVAAYLVSDAYGATTSSSTPVRSRRPVSVELTRKQRELLADAVAPMETIRTAADILRDAVQPTYVSIAEHIPGTNVLRPLVERGTLDVDIELLRDGLAALSHEYVPQAEARALYRDGMDLDSIACRRIGASAVLLVPLRRMGEALGAIQIVWTEDTEPGQVELARGVAEELSQWIAPDIAISRIAGEMERGYVNAIATVSSSLDDQFAFTNGHSHRVARTALEIAEILTLSDHDQRQLVYAAEMHDLGRVGVDHEILAKPEALSDDEWSAIRSIPARGAGIVDPVSYFGEVGDAILHLRERWDGEGYPNGLSGEDIPMLSRIIAIAEAYDAMTSDRPYRDALSTTDALRQLWFERGKKFDPAIVEAFVASRAPAATATL